MGGMRQQRKPNEQQESKEGYKEAETEEPSGRTEEQRNEENKTEKGIIRKTVGSQEVPTGEGIHI